MLKRRVRALFRIDWARWFWRKKGVGWRALLGRGGAWVGFINCRAGVALSFVVGKFIVIRSCKYVEISG